MTTICSIFFISVRPVITVPDLRIFIPPGEDVSLECIFEFHPRGLMWWERESGEILSRNDKYSIADYILNEFTIRSRLIIPNFQETDVGRYTCVGRNGFNKEGDREEGHILVNFVKGQYKCYFCHNGGSKISRPNGLVGNFQFVVFSHEYIRLSGP